MAIVETCESPGWRRHKGLVLTGRPFLHGVDGGGTGMVGKAEADGARAGGTVNDGTDIAGAGGNRKGRQGKASDTGKLTVQRQRTGGGNRAQRRAPRKDSWTVAKERLFLETLAETCNASEAARAADMSRASAYRRKQADPAFARAWDAAIDVGYAEIEALLMREVLFGSEVEELTLDADGAVKGRKIKRTRNLTIALRLLTLYRDKVTKIRATQGEGGRPDSPAAMAQVGGVLDDIGRLRAAAGT